MRWPACQLITNYGTSVSPVHATPLAGLVVLTALDSCTCIRLMVEAILGGIPRTGHGGKLIDAARTTSFIS
ncbi:hypothetical protein F5X97DRAFT_309887 [Nemania serpens]|nr:hypothetical protein F5X97DRAFT_309887 [Nemania serpens]